MNQESIVMNINITCPTCGTQQGQFFECMPEDLEWIAAKKNSFRDELEDMIRDATWENKYHCVYCVERYNRLGV